MIVSCKYNQQNFLPKQLIRYAFTQNEKGELDITIDKEYCVFGVRTYKNQKFYLVFTDTIHKEYPWWMPAQLYSIVNEEIPKKWIKKTHGYLFKDTVYAPTAYHGNENSIEDGNAPLAIMAAIIDDSCDS